MPTLFYRELPAGFGSAQVGLEWFDHTPAFNDVMYRAYQEGGSWGPGMYHMEGYDGEPYSWMELGEDPEGQALDFAQRMGAKLDFSRRNQPMEALRLEHPGMDKHWGLVLRGPSITRVRVMAVFYAMRNFPALQKEPRLVIVKEAGFFLQCDAPNYMYLESWCSQDTALEAALMMAELVAAPLELV